jgi:hypothetical protein
MQGSEPFGEWELSLQAPLSDGRPAVEAFKGEDIEDILLVVTYGGRTPPWPI